MGDPTERDLAVYRAAFDSNRAVSQDTLSPFEKETAEALYEKIGVITEIPRRFFWGRQVPREYGRSREHRVKAILSKEGIGFLTRKPVKAVIVPLPRRSASMLVVVDGHKRARYSALIGARNVPTQVVGLHDLAQAWNTLPERLAMRLSNEVNLAQARFEERMQFSGKQFIQPSFLPGGIKPAELQFYVQNLQRRGSTFVGRPHNTPIPVFVLHSRR